MFNAMRRVISESAISESDDLGRTGNIPSQQQQQYQQQQQQQQEYPQQQQQQQQLHSPDHPQRANLVEMDSDDFMDVESDDNRPISHIRKASGQFSSTHSSLSGASDHNHDPESDNIDIDIDDTDDGLLEQQHDSRALANDPLEHHVSFVANTNSNIINSTSKEQQLQEQHDPININTNTMNAMKLSSTATTLQRMDDDEDSTGSGSLRASSQNSSRDWGWFEDVHHPSEQMPQSPAGAAAGGKKKNTNKGSGSNYDNNSRGSPKYATLVPLSGTVRDVVQHQETGT
jgi:hypothetical protein